MFAQVVPGRLNSRPEPAGGRHEQHRGNPGVDTMHQTSRAMLNAAQRLGPRRKRTQPVATSDRDMPAVPRAVSMSRTGTTSQRERHRTKRDDLGWYRLRQSRQGRTGSESAQRFCGAPRVHEDLSPFTQHDIDTLDHSRAIRCNNSQGRPLGFASARPLSNITTPVGCARS